MRPRFALAALLFAGCTSLPEGRFDGLGPHKRPVSGASTEAQAWFDQGMNFLFAFNHDEAIRSFQRAAALDPHCAMAAWGEALANGPHINNSMVDEAHAQAAWAAIERARGETTTGVERELIEALSQRYANPQPPDRSPLDRAYADAMREVWKRHPEDADAGALFAEAMMDLRPWDLWKPDGSPQPGTEEIVATLEKVLAIEPNHPLGLHLTIHALEASPEPAKAEAAADRLRALTPGLGHLVHMPSHIDVRIGRWDKAVQANLDAIEADEKYLKRAEPPGFYRIYRAHNRHMLAFACMMNGQRARATDAVRAMIADMPPDFVKAAAPFIDGYFAAPIEIDVRFGRWEAVLAAPEPDAMFPLSRAIRLFARGVALAATGKTTEARIEQVLFRKAASQIPPEYAFGNNSSSLILAIADAVLDGEILFREDKLPESIAALEAGVRLEDTLRYDEPPGWMHPVRHSLGAILLASGNALDAEAVYREDLHRWPNNGWSLLGYARCLREAGRDTEAALVEAEFKRVWADADVEISSSCPCVPEK